MSEIKKSIFILLASVMPGLLFGQAYSNSPYSRFGLGDQEKAMLPRNIAMGGIAIGMRDPAFIDFINPASLSVRDSLSFLFDFGMVGKQTEISSGGITSESKDINFNHLAVAFPITRWLGASAGVVPFSTVTYDIASPVEEGHPEYIPEVGRVDYLYRGKGGVHRFFLGGGAKIFKGLSVGVNLSYLFGNMEQARSITFIEQENFFNTKITENSIVGDLYIDMGLQYVISFKDEFELTLGAVYNHDRKIKVEREEYTENTLFNSFGTFHHDTIEYNSGIKGNFDLPKNYGVGFTFRKGDQLILGADYTWQEWDKAKFFGESDSLVNSSTISGGLEFTPNRTALRGYLRRINYRIGGHYSNTYLQLKEEQLKDFGISFGVGLPLKRTRSTINLSFELGKRTPPESDLINERYGIINFSLTLYDIWFMKRKFE